MMGKGKPAMPGKGKGMPAKGAMPAKAKGMPPQGIPAGRMKAGGKVGKGKC